MLHIYRLTLGALLSFTLPAAKAQDAGEPIQDLEAFIVRESTAYIGGTLDPESRPVRGLFSLDMTVHQIPRSVTMISPEHMELLQIDDLRSLSKFGAGTQIINHYGVTGTPIIRGAKGSALLNGMTRSFNLNEMPLSLGSCESIDIVKGPTPPHLSPTHVGGFVNLVPKAPFFDATRGSLALTVGSYDQYRALLDYGGPTLALGRPAAYRVSVTLNREAGYYDRIRNDFESAYFALKTDLTHKVSADFGVEYFHFRSNENAGWNRPTQALIDRGAYILGEPINITDPAFQNTANRDLVSFPLGYGWSNGIQDFNALVVPSAIVDAAVSEGRISEAARDAMLDLSNPDDLARAYGQPLPSTGAPDPAYTARASVSATLAGLMSNPNEGYRYTRQYFDLGGEVFTSPIQGNQILADSEDDAEAFNWVGFFDLSWQGNNGTSWQSKTLFDILETSKLSSYGYAIDTQQWVLANNLQATRYLDFAIRSTLSYGLGLRYTFSEMVQDYFAEPFSRRDVSLPTVTGNSRVLTGGQVGPDGLNYWSPDIGANVRSHLTQTAFFGQFDSQLSDRIRVMLSARAEQAWYQTAMPGRVQRASNAQRTELDQSGNKFIYSLGASLTYALSPDVNLYLAAQDGIALDLTQAGGVYGEENFASADLLEAGIKVNLLGGRIQGNLSVWEWNQSRFNERDFQSEPLAGKGVEFEATVQLIPDSLFLLLSAENQRLRRKTGLGFRTLPRSEIDWALEAGVMNGGVDPYPENNPELNYPGFPENTYKAHLIWKPAPFQFALSAVRSRAYWLNFEQTLKLPSSLLVSAYAKWTSGPWAVAINVENLTNETHFLGADPLFSSNTLVTKGEPRRYGLTLSVEF